MTESTADFKGRISAIIARSYGFKSITDWKASTKASRPCVKKPTDDGYYPPSKRVGSGQRDFKQNAVQGIVERPKTAKPTRKSKNQQ